MKNYVCFFKLRSARASRHSSAAPAYLVAFLLTLASLVSPAQAHPTFSTGGSVHGIISVIDPNGQSYGAPGAQVRLIATPSDAFQLAIADDSGQYKFDSVRPGSYRLEVTLDGFEKVTRPLTIHDAEAVFENIKLLVKGAPEEDTVKAERVGLSLKDAGPANEIKQQASQTYPLVNERLRNAVLPGVKGVRTSHGELTVYSTVASYNALNESSRLHFLGTPNQTIHAPNVFSLEMHVLRTYGLKVSPRISLGNQHHGRRPQFPDVQGFYPRDFQGANLGMLSGGIGRMLGMRLVIQKK